MVRGRVSVIASSYLSLAGERRYGMLLRATSSTVLKDAREWISEASFVSTDEARAAVSLQAIHVGQFSDLTSLCKLDVQRIPPEWSTEERRLAGYLCGPRFPFGTVDIPRVKTFLDPKTRRKLPTIMSPSA